MSHCLDGETVPYVRPVTSVPVARARHIGETPGPHESPGSAGKVGQFECVTEITDNTDRIEYYNPTKGPVVPIYFYSSIESQAT